MDARVKQKAMWLIEAAMREDVASGDVTTRALIPESARMKAVMRAREPLMVCGGEIAALVFQEVMPSLEVDLLIKDGTAAKAGEAILLVKGGSRAILTGERIALNFVQRLSGIATLTNFFVREVEGTKVKILDTRKTTPGWRELEKYAVLCGGGANHRMGLYDLILIKDNHLAWLKSKTEDPVGEAVALARRHYPQLNVEVEADHLSQVEAALRAGADIILLDNMTLDQMRSAVTMVAGKAKLEASGGIQLTNVREVAQTGVDFISVGALTHSARSVDIGLDYEAGA